jgi:hypothetical protein
LIQRYQTQVLAVRDTLALAMAGIQTFRRDLATVGAATVIGRAARATQRCEATRRYLERARTQLQQTAVPNPSVREAVRAYLAALVDVGAALQEHCEQGLAPSGPGTRADSLRAWGPYRASQLERAFRIHIQAAHRLARAAGFRIEPQVP